jgi:pyruvate formate lyase activating enzyme
MADDMLRYPVVREALLYEKLSGDRVKCGLCDRRCRVSPGKKGYCRTRVNLEGKMYTLVYGDVSALESRRIEIKPFFHYWPGSTALTLSSWSCNFDCVWCQNYHLSKTEPDPETARYFSPGEIVGQAVRGGDEGLCISFQEPTIMTDWAVPLFRLGREKGLYCCYVSNGYMTPEALRLLRESGMDGIKIDVKGDPETYRRYCGGADVEKVWRNVREAKSMGYHVEVVNLVITGVNDDDTCLRWVIESHLREAGPETPLHFTRYFPAYRFSNPPTAVEILENAYQMAKEAGISFPYLGNVQGHQYENTYCPRCNERLIRRSGYVIVDYRVARDNKCPKCGEAIPITGNFVPK